MAFKKIDTLVEQKFENGAGLIDVLKVPVSVVEALQSIWRLYSKGLLSMEAGHLKLRYDKNTTPSFDNQFSFKLSEDSQKILNGRNKVINTKSLYAQQLATEHTISNKLGFMRAFNDIDDKSIVFLGDDDFMSVIACLEFVPKNVVAIDIDPTVLRNIAKLAKEYGLNISTIRADLSRPLPSILRHRFDTFCTDSSHCLGGILLFLNRGAEALKDKKGTSGYFVVQTIDEPPIMDLKKRAVISTELMKIGFVISSMFPASVEYDLPSNEIKNFENNLLKLLQKCSNGKEFAIKINLLLN